MTQNFPEKDFLLQTLDLANTELMRRFGDSKLIVKSKPDTSLVTEADLASEKVILEQIRKHFPNDIIYSEESGLSSTERTPHKHIWIIDPLDGTTNFANSYPFFCVSIGRGVIQTNGTIEPVLGGISNPISQKMYVGAKGIGAFCNNRQIRVCPPRPLKNSFLVTGFYYQKGDKLKEEIKRFARIADECSTIRRDGAAALDLALVAEGIFDAFWERGLAPWDVCAGALLIKEAGGELLNYTLDATFNMEGDGIIAGNASIVRDIAQRIPV
jgi:myo-inositol-1(or 4)-monophosphatase